MAKESLEYIDPSKLEVDIRVQRHVPTEQRVAALEARWNRLHFGALIVSRRDSGALIILDGQTRYTVWRRVGDQSEHLPAVVYDGLELHEEAAMFLALNDGKVVQAIDKFPVQVRAQEEAAVAVNSVLESRGWRVDRAHGNRPFTFSAVTALTKVFSGAGVVPGPRADLVRDVMDVITNAWRGKPNSAHNQIVGGLGVLLAKAGSRIDFGSLVERLSQEDPEAIILQAQPIRQALGVKTGAEAVALVIRELYNKKRGEGNRIPSWR